jgi:serine protease Do
MTELERIQMEIDKDLINLGLLTPKDDTAEAGSNDALVYHKPSVVAPVFSHPAFEESAPFAEEAKADAPAIPEPATPRKTEEDYPGFYRETIKQPPFPIKPRMSWRKRLVLVCLVCTLGTGTLGMGIGAAAVTADFFWLGGINRVKAGENLADYFESGVESTRYVFSNADNAREGTLSDMVRLMEPSVVSVSSTFKVENEFYSQFQGENVGNASGIIFREDARNVYIATNYHVVGGATDVAVSIAGGASVQAEPVGMNSEADLAVISVRKSELKRVGVDGIVIAAFGDSDNMDVGDTVIAIGNALGAGNIATQGIISAKEKVIPVEGRTLTVLQTDAAINFGNSGGALFNIRGEVIGINSAKLMSYSVEGMGYSISSNIALPILEDLMQTSSRPQLGIMGGTLTAEAAEQFGLTDIPLMGVLVSSVIPGMGAERAGIQAGDVITGFNGTSIFNFEQLKAAIRECEIGDTAQVNVLRDGKLIKLSVHLDATEQQGFTG